MIEIRITDPQQAESSHLKALARFFMELAGEPMNSTTTVVDNMSVIANHMGTLIKATKDESVFNAAELAESEQIAQEVVTAQAERNPDPKAVFGAPSTVGAPVAPIAPAAPPVTLTAPTAPVPPAPTPASVAETVAPLTTAPAPDVDSSGLPWDGRIHSRTKAVNNDGSWKKRRGVDDATVAQVEAELRGVPQTARVIDDGPDTPPAAPIFPQHAPVAPPAPVAAPIVTPPAAPVPATEIKFQQLLPKVTVAVSAGQLTQERVGQVLAAHGLDSLPKLITRPDLVPIVYNELFGAQ